MEKVNLIFKEGEKIKNSSKPKRCFLSKRNRNDIKLWWGLSFNFHDREYIYFRDILDIMKHDAKLLKKIQKSNINRF